MDPHEGDQHILSLIGTLSYAVVPERCTKRDMARSIHLEPHLSADELATRYRRTQDPVERSHWHFLWLLARGFTAKAIASIDGYSAYWICQIARRYNARGQDGVKDQPRLARSHGQLLTAPHYEELRAALRSRASQHDRWCGRTVAAWMAQRLRRPVCRQLGWVYLRRLGARLRMPRPRHVRAAPQAQADFKARLRPLLREVATAFSQARVELWAMDEHRIGLKPILRKVWSLDKEHPVAPVQHRYEWRYLVGIVHPASGRTVFHLATSVSISLFEAELPPLSAKRDEPQEEDRVGPGSGGLAQHPALARARPCPLALPSALIP